MKQIAQEIENLTQNRTSEILECLDRFILDDGRHEFLIPYYKISYDQSITVTNHDIVSYHNSCYFSMLGNVEEILHS